MKLVIFDVDGTLTPRRPASTAVSERTLLPGVAIRLAALKQKNIALALATNQGGAERERSIRLSTGDVLAHLRWLQQRLDLDASRFATTHQRKKPKPAMLNELMHQFNTIPTETLFVGDAENDSLVAKAAEIQFVYAHDFFATSVDRLPSCLNNS